MKKGYFIPEETIRETLPSKFELILRKLKKITCGGKKAPVIFQIPQNIDTEKDLFAITNLHKIKETFDINLKPVNKDVTVQKVKKLYKIKHNANFLPLTFKQKLFLLGALVILPLLITLGYTWVAVLLLVTGTLFVGFQNYVAEQVENPLNQPVKIANSSKDFWEEWERRLDSDPSWVGSWAYNAHGADLDKSIAYEADLYKIHDD